MSIPIQNIYYLLSYAWNKLDEEDRVSVSLDDDANYVDLFAKILINGTRRLLKRGFEKSYVSETKEISGVKAKLELTQTIKSMLHYKQKTVCTMDDFSIDILQNQILVSTFFRLLNTRELDSRLKAEIRHLIRKIPGVSLRKLRKEDFKKIRYHRNNEFYKFLINVCELIYDNTLPNEEEGTLNFVDFTRDERKMNRLFEGFILNYYKREFPDWKVSSRKIRWKFQLTGSERDYSYLPEMKTDITIEKEDEIVIINAKYYRETMASYYGSKKIHSGNLYQLFSYLLNQRVSSKKSERARGVLLYPAISEDVNLEYVYENHFIQIKTINLNQHWSEISKRLNDIC